MCIRDRCGGGRVRRRRCVCVNGLRGRGTRTWHACVCYGSTGRGTARGRGTRRGRATDTAGPSAVEYTQIRRPVPAPTA
eukprot:3052698-Prymnesium_polylepis.1